MEVREIPFGTPAFDEALHLRHLILRVPLGLTFRPADIEQEWDSTHLGIYRGQRLLGVLTMLPLNDRQVKMRQVAVTEELQGKGIGSMLVRGSERWAAAAGFAEIVLHAREVAVPFYLRMGYERVGERFEEVNIPHFKMRKRLNASETAE